MEGVTTENHPEQGPVWDWRQEHWSEIMERAGANYNGAGPGVMRKIPDSALEEIKKIFDVTGATERFQQIEKYSAEKAKELGIELNENLESDYVKFVSSSINKNHNS
jgi:heterodisulfide reductase subunit C